MKSVIKPSSAPEGQRIVDITQQPYPFTWVDAWVERDLITPTFNTTSDVYIFTLNSVTVQTITVNYTDSTKEVLSSVVKS